MVARLDRPQYRDIIQSVDGLILYAPCDDRSGSIVDTKLGTSRGAVTGTVTYGARSSAPRAGTSSLQFTAQTGTRVSGTNTNLPTSATAVWSFFGWVLMPTVVTGAGSMLFGWGNPVQTGGNKRYFIRFNSRVYFWGDAQDVQATVDYDIGRPQLIAATRASSGLITVYKNGVNVGSQTRTLSTTTQAWEFGRKPYFGGSSELTAHLSHFGVINRTMTAQELRWLYDEGVG